MNRGGSSDHSKTHVRDYILDVAEGFARRGGYSCFSMGDVAAKADIPQKVVRLHFENHEMLTVALIQRYTARLLETVGAPDEKGSLDKLISTWCDAAAEGDEMCPCILYGTEMAELPDSVVAQMDEFFDVVIDWIAQALKCKGDSKHPEAVLACLSGAMVTVRSMKRPDEFADIARRLIEPIVDECTGEPSNPSTRSFGRVPQRGPSI